MTDFSLVSIRLAEPRDEPALWLMLTFAASMGEGGASRVEEARADPYLRSYVEDFGRSEGDLGVVAVGPTGEVIGAAWVRCFDASTVHVGGAAEPELSIGVLPGHRGQGVGGRLLDGLLKACQNRVSSIVLSVRADNPAARLYQRIGFEEVDRIENRVGGLSLVMRCEVG